MPHTASGLSPLLAAATRTVQWEVTPVMRALMYASMGVALAVFAYGWWQRVRVWRLGKPEVAWDRPGERLRRTLVDALAQGRLLRERVAGGAHALLFFGFLVLAAATFVVFLEHDLGLPVMRGAFYLGFQSLAVDLFGLACLLGVLVAAARRLSGRVARLRPSSRGDHVLLGALAGILLTGFALEGLRIGATGDPWRSWSPIGNAVASLTGVGPGDAAAGDAYRGLWLLHMALWHALLAAIPFSKLQHAVTAPLTVFLAPLGRARGVPPAIDFESAPATLGARTAADLTWRQLLSLDACTECGRCQAVCPAYAEGKPLSPRALVTDLRDHVRAHGVDGPPLAGGVIAAETIWSCTTCRACEEACPVRIEHVPLVLQLRQNLAMEQAAVPDRVADLVASVETRAHPFRGAAATRDDLFRDVPGGGDEDAILYWTGCAAAFDTRAGAVARAFVRILDHAGVPYRVLGNEERCCGDPLRRTGNEYHWSMLAGENVAALQRAGARRIVTHCPHCLQTLRHEYGALGGDYQVVHHTAFLAELLEGGRLRLAGAPEAPVAFHDPCYLGRYNDGFDPPRRALDLIGATRVELARSRSASFCCGAGGGHAFFDDGAGGKINRNRVREIAGSGARTIGTGCPFCLAMLEDGVRAEGADLEARDIAELIAEQLAD